MYCNNETGQIQNQGGRVTFANREHNLAREHILPGREGNICPLHALNMGYLEALHRVKPHPRNPSLSLSLSLSLPPSLSISLSPPHSHTHTPLTHKNLHALDRVKP